MGDEFDQYKVTPSAPQPDEFAQYKAPAQAQFSSYVSPSTQRLPGFQPMPQNYGQPGFIDRMTERFGANLRNTGQAIMHPLDTISSMLNAKETPIDALSEQYKKDPANLAGDVMTTAIGSAVTGSPPGINMAEAGASRFVPEGIAHPLQGIQRGLTELQPNLTSLVKKPISSTLMAAPRAIKAGLGQDIQVLPVNRPAPAWQTSGVTPTTPGFDWQTSTPEEIQAQLQRMANRPRTAAPTTPEAIAADRYQAVQLGQPQNVPLPNIAPTKAATVDPYRQQTLPAMTKGISGNVEAHAYNPDTQTMYTHFKSGDIYKYEGVPPKVYDQFVNAESQGSFHFNNIRGRYATEKIGKVAPTRTRGQQVSQALGSQK